MAYALKHRITGVALRDLLTLLNAALPGSLPNSCYLFNKLLFDNNAKVETVLYCPKCRDIVEKEAVMCPTCESRLNEHGLLKNGNYFLTVSKKDQKPEMVKYRNLIELIKECRTNAHPPCVARILV